MEEPEYFKGIEYLKETFVEDFWGGAIAGQFPEALIQVFFFDKTGYGGR